MVEVEQPTVRRYRYLMRTASTGVLEAAHVHALGALGSDARAEVLTTVQERLVAGLRCKPTDTRAVSRLVILGERRRPGVLLTAYRPSLLTALAAAVVEAPAARPSLAGYEDWDGVEPQVTEAHLELLARDWERVDTDPHHQWHVVAGRASAPQYWLGGGW